MKYRFGASGKGRRVNNCIQARCIIAFNRPRKYFLFPYPDALPTNTRLFSKCAENRRDLPDTGKRKREDIGDKDLFLDVLGSTATKREARSYLSRFTPLKPSDQPQYQNPSDKGQVGASLGNLHLPLRAVDESPVFTQAPSQDRLVDQATESLHVALVKVRAPQLLNDAILEGVGHTFSQLTRLGLSCVVVIDCEDGQNRNSLDACRVALEQGDRVVTAVDLYKGRGARRLDSVIGVASVQKQYTPSVKVGGLLQITNRNLLLAPLRRGVIPVVVPIGFVSDTQTLVPVLADDVVLALTQELAGLKPQKTSEEDPHEIAEKMERLQKEISLDRVILLDPLGGIPSKDMLRGFHVFINLEQEYNEIRKELRQFSKNVKPEVAEVIPLAETISNPINSSVGFGLNVSASTSSTAQNVSQISSGPANSTRFASHLRNLDLLKHTLALLPPSSSAIIITPQEAANSGRMSVPASQSLGVGTRRQQNPLIHNLLTDKPVISSSLPSNRTQKTTATPGPHPSFIPSPATFVKRGMPISIIPDPLTHPWTPPATPSSAPSIQLSDPRIDLTRLVHLIEDSFNRKLDVRHYLSRINNRIAGIIIAGEYEGGALLTWENPPSSSTTFFPVPYLDKFAVRKRSQGAGGVEDVVFKAMVRDCFPKGVCWRSRADNPVNKWYFERAAGSWKMPGTGWTMFWTEQERGERERGGGSGSGSGSGDAERERGDRGDVERAGMTWGRKSAAAGLDSERFLAYADVCRGVEPSWADQHAVLD